MVLEVDETDPTLKPRPIRGKLIREAELDAISLTHCPNKPWRKYGYSDYQVAVQGGYDQPPTKLQGRTWVPVSGEKTGIFDLGLLKRRNGRKPSKRPERREAELGDMSQDYAERYMKRYLKMSKDWLREGGVGTGPLPKKVDPLIMTYRRLRDFTDQLPIDSKERVASESNLAKLAAKIDDNIGKLAGQINKSATDLFIHARKLEMQGRSRVKKEDEEKKQYLITRNEEALKEELRRLDEDDATTVSNANA